MSTVVNINTVNIGAEFARHAESEMERGASAESLRDIGEQVPEGAEAQPQEPVTPLHEDLEQLEAMEQRQLAENAQDNARRMYLIQLVKEVGSFRKMEGFAVNHDETPEDRTAVEEKNYAKQKHAQETLERACGVCALADTCEIRGDLGKWVATHPYAKSDQKLMYSSVSHPDIKVAEGRMKFVGRLGEDPLADCVPEAPLKQATQKAA